MDHPTVVVEQPNEQYTVYRYGGRTVEVHQYAGAPHLCFVWLEGGAEPLIGRLLPSLTAQLLALETLGVVDGG